jgi:hypothetical protein
MFRLKLGIIVSIPEVCSSRHTECYSFKYFGGCLTMHFHHEIKWNANLMQQCNLLKFSSSTCFGRIRPSSGVLDVKLQRTVFCTQFVDGWWSWEPLRRLCIRFGRCVPNRTQKLGVLFYQIKGNLYAYLKFIVHDKLLKSRQSFRITLYFCPVFAAVGIELWIIISINVTCLKESKVFVCWTFWTSSHLSDFRSSSSPGSGVSVDDADSTCHYYDH